MSLFDLLAGKSTLITGVETDPDDPTMTRVYVGARSNWNYVLTSGEDAEAVLRSWRQGGHTFTTLDPDAVVYHDEEGKLECAKRWNELDGWL